MEVSTPHRHSFLKNGRHIRSNPIESDRDIKDLVAQYPDRVLLLYQVSLGHFGLLRIPPEMLTLEALSNNIIFVSPSRIPPEVETIKMFSMPTTGKLAVVLTTFTLKEAEELLAMATNSENVEAQSLARYRLVQRAAPRKSAPTGYSETELTSRALEPLTGHLLEATRNWSPVRESNPLAKWSEEYHGSLSGEYGVPHDEANLGKLEALIPSLSGKQLQAALKLKALLTTDEEVTDLITEFQQDISEEKKEALFRELLRKGLSFKIYKPLQPATRPRFESLLNVLGSVSSDLKRSLFALAIDSPDYAEDLVKNLDLILRTMKVPGFFKDYDQRVKLLLSGLKYLIDEEHRIAVMGMEEGPAPGAAAQPLMEAPAPLLPGLEEAPEAKMEVKEEVTSAAPFIIGLSEINSWGVQTINSPYKAWRILQLFVGDYLQDLDLSQTVITGSAVTAAVYNPYGHNVQRHHLKFVPTNPSELQSIDPKSNLRLELAFPAYLTLPEGPPNPPLEIAYLEPKWTAISEDKVQITLGDYKATLKYAPGSDVDLAVLNHKNFDSIAQAHIKVIQKHYPQMRAEIVEKKAGSRMYQLTDPEHKARPVQIYKSSLKHIITHHTGPVRGYISRDTFGEPKFHLTASAIRSYITKSVEDYYYFAGRSPIDILSKLYLRGFGIQLPYSIMERIWNLSIWDMGNVGRDVTVLEDTANFLRYRNFLTWHLLDQLNSQLNRVHTYHEIPGEYPSKDWDPEVAQIAKEINLEGLKPTWPPGGIPVEQFLAGIPLPPEEEPEEEPLLFPAEEE